MIVPLHGGTLDAARRRFPAAPLPFIDLSTGINPVPYPFAPLPPEALTRLPEPAALAALQQAAALAYGAADPACVVAAPGTQILISLLPRLLPRPGVVVFGPTYAEHARAWRLAGAAVRETNDLTAPEAAPEPAAVLCNPNNPDGRRLSPGAVMELAARHALLVVDEAFADFDPGASVVPLLAARPGLVVLRSFGKAYGLAGLRLGFALAEPGIAALIRDALGPWPVSGTALAIGRQALGDGAWIAGSAVRLRADAARLDAMLAAARCRVLGGTTLFRLVETAAADPLADHLGRHGIVVRRFPERPGLLRFGLPGPAEWDRVAGALSSW